MINTNLKSKLLNRTQFEVAVRFLRENLPESVVYSESRSDFRRVKWADIRRNDAKYLQKRLSEYGIFSKIIETSMRWYTAGGTALAIYTPLGFFMRDVK